MRRDLRRPRGQAVVEMAVSMLIIVPTFMYILFLDDMLRAKLDLEEAVVTAPWEYARLDYEQGGAGKGNRKAVRLGWCDHTTAYNSYDRSYDCSESVHHVALSAHQCWMTEGAKQVSCDVTPGDYKLTGLFTAESFHDDYTKGGTVRCYARLGVINYYLPQKLFQDFTQEKVTRTEKRYGDVHDNYGLAEPAHYLLEEQAAALVVDTWALGTMEKIGPDDDSGNFYDRVQDVYEPYGQLAAGMGMQFYMNMIPFDVVNPLLAQDSMGDDPLKANMAFDPDNGTFNEDMQGSPHDFELGGHYMGAQDTPE